MYTSQHPLMERNTIPLTIPIATSLQGGYNQVCEAAMYGPDELDKMNPEELARYLELLRINWSATYSE